MKTVKCGVPQGSTLGPLLFLIFVNEINNSTEVLDPVLFADDANLFCSDNNIRTLFETVYFCFIHSCINYANIAWASTNNTKLKKLFRKQKQAVRVIFSQSRFTHACPLIKTLNALNVHQINLLQVLLFMLKIKTNSSPGIFLHRFQTINHKYATRYSRNDFKEPKRERLIMPNITFMRSVRVFGTAF